MEEKTLNELVIVEQLPVIREQLQIISDEVDKEINYALSLEVNEDSVKEVKNARARLNKIKTTMEEKRKQVKNAVLNPYNEFETIYNELVKEKLSNADNELKEKINSVESTLKQEKYDEIELFARQHFEVNNIDDIVSFDDIGLNITLSASMKSLKEQVLKFVDKINNDLKLIELEEYKDEILVEYKNNLDFSKSKIDVISRHKQLEELQSKLEEKREQLKQEEKVVEKVEEIIEIPEEIIEIQFTIKTTKNKAKKVKEFLLAEGIEYE